MLQWSWVACMGGTTDAAGVRVEPGGGRQAEAVAGRRASSVARKATGSGSAHAGAAPTWREQATRRSQKTNGRGSAEPPAEQHRRSVHDARELPGRG